MSDETTQQTTEEPQTTNQEPTLEDVYASVKFDEPATTQAQPVVQQPVVQAPPIPQTPNVPDPYDSENFKAYMAQQAAGTTELRTALSTVLTSLSHAQQQEAKRVIDADIQDAVKSVNEVVGFDKPKVIEAMLDAKAREDTRFKQLWDNRRKNPTAWNNALKAVSREIANDLSVKIDPKLSQAQQARKLAQSQMATTQVEDDKDPAWGSSSGADFDAAWQRTVHGGN